MSSRWLGTARKPRSMIIHDHPEVRGHKVEIREYREPILMANGRWTSKPMGFALTVDGVEAPARCQTKELAEADIAGWVDYLEWVEAGRPLTTNGNGEHQP